jgi:hypothetical protein
MANIFRKKDSYIDRVNRSTFDLSFVNNLTMKFGAITPVCLLPASFGDSFQINARFNLQLLPTVFPIQTQLYVRLHFVYVRTRTLWEDWMSFFGGDETVTPPWIDPTAETTLQGHKQFNVIDDLQTGTLADYLGIPTVITGTFGKTADAKYEPLDLSAPINLKNLSRGLLIRSTPPENVTALQKVIGSSKVSTYFDSAAIYPSDGAAGVDSSSWLSYLFSAENYTKSLKKGAVIYIDFGFNFSQSDFGEKIGIFLINAGGAILSSSLNVECRLISGTLYSLTLLQDFDVSQDLTGFLICFKKDVIVPSSAIRVVKLPNQDTYYVKTGATSIVYPSGSVQWTKPEAANCPFYTPNSNLPAIPLSALPFRAYESYYNAFGRDIRNNPFIVDGKPEYNKYVPSLKGGRDTYKYQLHYANWEPDAYTTALQSPQAGVAPLVGITSLGEATFRDAAGTEYHAQLETAEDGDTVTGFQVKSSNAPADVVRNLIGMATSGISISDFRNVNSLQRFLEIRVRQHRQLAKSKGRFLSLSCE